MVPSDLLILAVCICYQTEEELCKHSGAWCDFLRNTELVPKNPSGLFLHVGVHMCVWTFSCVHTCVKDKDQPKYFALSFTF